MKVTEKIRFKINRMKYGETFNYQQLSLEKSEYSAAAKAIGRLVEKGIIKRVSTGIFYKPKQSVFGDLKPSESEMLKLYLFDNGNRIAYITGDSLYNRMGLTTQISKTIKVASKIKRVITEIEKIKVKAVKSYIDVDDENYILLEILDALKDFKRIADLDINSAIVVLKNLICNLSNKDLSKLVDYSLEYPPRVAALLGAILEFSLDKKNNYLQKLETKLNPFTSYKIGVNKEVLPTMSKWNIS